MGKKINIEDQYSINEILAAVQDLGKTKKKEKIEIKKNNILKKNNSDIPANTLKLIEEAEKVNH
tara:strand:- start:983 stop:1174 length:192 start_codon:yes stop_codon:yes gene_type:complete